MAKFFHDTTPLHLESGEMLPELTIAYDTYGERNEDDSNIIWVCHALTDVGCGVVVARDDWRG